MKTMPKNIATLLRSGHAKLNGQDYIGAAAFFSEAAKRGSPEGSYMLGLLYSFDTFPDFVYDERLAAKFFARAADRGHTQAQMRIADMYATGCGVAQSREKADMYWSAAATAGDPDAQFFYAMFLFYDADETERGKNVKAAKHWLMAARNKGGAGIQIALREIRQWEKDGILRDPKDTGESNLDDDVEEWSEQ